MPKHIYTTQEALRMVGHLLEHHPAVAEAAQDKQGSPVTCTAKQATRWCVVGACIAVSRALEFPIYVSQIEGFLNTTDAVRDWDGSGTSPATRLAIARKLQKA